MATEGQRQVAGTSQDSVGDRLCALFDPKGHLEKARQRTRIALRGESSPGHRSLCPSVNSFGEEKINTVWPSFGSELSVLGVGVR